MGIEKFFQGIQFFSWKKKKTIEIKAILDATVHTWGLNPIRESPFCFISSQWCNSSSDYNKGGKKNLRKILALRQKFKIWFQTGPELRSIFLLPWLPSALKKKNRKKPKQE